MNEKIYWICLSEIFGPANHNLWKLMRYCRSAEEGYRKIAEGRFLLTPSEKKRFSSATPDNAEKILNECRGKNIQVITYDDKDYPSRLRTIFDPPAVLYASGDCSCLNDEMQLSVVGTREPSEYGSHAAFAISEELARTGFTIVSGFAAGVDSAAHRGALSGGGKTIAVLGCGTDVEYPKANSDIRENIIRNGVFISEFPPGTPPLGRNFPSRNRIISGISLGVFVAEAPLSSGALITADIAVEQGRDVFCLPPSDIFSRSFQGVVKYLRDGAVPVFSHLDIIYEYYTNFSHKLSSMKPSEEYIPARSESAVFSEGKNRMDSELIRASSIQKRELPSFDGLSDIQKKIAELLSEGALHIEDISARTDIAMPVLLSEITELEISGTVISLPGKVYSLS